MDIEAHPFDLRECIESALDLVAARAAEKHLEIAYQFEGEVPPAVDRRRHAAAPGAAQPAQQRGQVHRSGRGRADRRRRRGDELHFAVRDTGIGLSDAGKSRLFQKFSQADSARRASTAAPGWAWRSASCSSS